jgi:hypothetical protein
MRMKNHKIKQKPRHPSRNNPEIEELNEILEHCIRKGLVEKTEHGYIFKPEFFETLEIYED